MSPMSIFIAIPLIEEVEKSSQQPEEFSTLHNTLPHQLFRNQFSSVRFKLQMTVLGKYTKLSQREEELSLERSQYLEQLYSP